MRIKKLKKNLHPFNCEEVEVKTMGEYSEIRYCTKKTFSHTKKLDADSYVVISTGEVKQYNHTISRDENIIGVKQSMARLRDIIRTNVCNPDCCRWCSLTYADNMQDANQLYEDYKRFNQRFQRYLKNQYGTTAEWIAVAEPQARGAWHMHVIYIFYHKAPFIANKDLARIWGKGFTSIKALKDSDDVALYLSAYLADMPLEEALQNGKRISDINPHDLKTVEKDGKTKAYIKGGRIGAYPAGMRLYRVSRGVKRPTISEMTEKDIQALLAAQNAKLTYEKTIALYDCKEAEEADEHTVIYNYRHYKRGDSREK